MSTKKTNQKPEKSRLMMYLATMVILLGTVTATAFSLNKSDTKSSGNIASENEGKEQSEAQVITEGESLIIPITDQSGTANFYPVEVDGVNMEILAVKDSDGYIRTAFNTCQVCYASGRGYYEQEGEHLVCQNCRNRFTVSQVEVRSGGCNPWPIFEDSKTVTDETIEISYDFLKESSKIFANWKTIF